MFFCFIVWQVTLSPLQVLEEHIAFNAVDLAAPCEHPLSKRWLNRNMIGQIGGVR